uniref:Splicing factor 3a subunit 1 n=1 Tax=Homo sapiens TaxID=9606 RepID=F8WC79_HUMAN
MPAGPVQAVPPPPPVPTEPKQPLVRRSVRRRSRSQRKR